MSKEDVDAVRATMASSDTRRRKNPLPMTAAQEVGFWQDDDAETWFDMRGEPYRKGATHKSCDIVQFAKDFCKVTGHMPFTKGPKPDAAAGK